MDRFYFDCANECRKKGGMWKVISAILFFAFIATAIAAFSLKIKNKKYRDALIKESEEFPITPEQEEELAELRRRGWASAHSPANRMSDEERMAENRVVEEE